MSDTPVVPHDWRRGHGPIAHRTESVERMGAPLSRLAADGWLADFRPTPEGHAGGSLNMAMVFVDSHDLQDSDPEEGEP